MLGNGTRDGHALLLATGKLSREVIAPVGKTNQFQGFFRRHRVSCNLSDHSHILQRSQAGDEVIELEYEAHVVAAKVGQLPLTGASQVGAVIDHRSFSRRVQPAQNVEQGRFTTARCAEQHHELASVQLQVHAPQGMHLDLTHAVHLGDAVYREDGLSAGWDLTVLK